MLLPFHKTLTTWPLMMAALMGIFIGNPKEKWKRLTSNPRIWIFALLYLLFLVGYLFSQDTATAARDLKLKLSIPLIPILVGAFIELRKTEIRRILTCFVIACITFSLFALSKALFDLITTGAHHFYYKDLVAFTLIHPSYIGMFLGFAIIITGMEFVQQFDNLSSKRKWLLAGIILFLMLTILLLTAKMAILSVFLFFNVAIFIWVRKKWSAGRALLTILVMNVVGFGALMSLPYTRDRFALLFSYKEVSYTNSVDSRSEIWKSVMQLTQEHHFKGVGSGDAEEELVAYYERNDFKTGVEERYNAHNQYFQLLVETGLAGMVFFILVLLLSGSLALRDKNYLYLAFIGLWMVNIATESMLKTQSGVVFYAFFNSVLGLWPASRKTD